MKIKITGSSSDSYWYASKIGEVFEVLKEEELEYKGGDDGRAYGWVQKTDCIPYKEESKEEKPATKRVGVIWFGEVPVDKCENPMLIDEGTGYVYDQVELIPVELIPDDQGDIVPGGVGEQLYIVKPPTPEPETETVEDVLERIPLVSEHRKAFLNGDDNATMSKYISRLEAWQKDLKAAQERNG